MMDTDQKILKGGEFLIAESDPQIFEKLKVSLRRVGLELLGKNLDVSSFLMYFYTKCAAGENFRISDHRNAMPPSNHPYKSRFSELNF